MLEVIYVASQMTIRIVTMGNTKELSGATHHYSWKKKI
jgi:hypothetical protein